MTNTYNPLVKEEITKFNLVQQRPVAEPGTVLVFSGEGLPLLIVKQGEQGATWGELVWGKYNLLYRVDITEHQLAFKCNLPSGTPPYKFLASISFNCSVRDPLTIVKREIRDVRQLLEPLITELMRNQSWKYKIEDRGTAEQEIGISIKQAVYDVGFQLNNVAVKFELEQKAEESLQKLRDIQEQIAATQVQIQLNSLTQNANIEAQRKQGQFQYEQSINGLNLEEEKRKRELAAKSNEADFSREERLKDVDVDIENERKKSLFDIEKQERQEWLDFEREKRQFEREKLQFEREKLKIQAELELEKIRLGAAPELLQLSQSVERQKNQFNIEQARDKQDFEIESMRKQMEFYSPIIQGGNWQALALELVKNPHDVRFVIEQINSQKQENREAFLDTLKMLVGKGLIEGHQLEPFAKNLLEGLINTFTQAAGSESVDTQEAVLENLEGIPSEISREENDEQDEAHS